MEKVHDGSVYQFLGPLPEAASFDVLVSQAVEQHIGAVNGVVHIVDRALPEHPYLEILICTLPFTRVGFLLSANRQGQFWLPSHRGGTVFAPVDAVFTAAGITPQRQSLSRILAAHFCPEQTVYFSMLHGGDDAAKQSPPWQPLLVTTYPIEGTRKFELQSSLLGSGNVRRCLEARRTCPDADWIGCIVVCSDHLANDGILNVAEELVWSQ